MVMLNEAMLLAAGSFAVVVVGTYTAFQVSPWPAILYYHPGRIRQIIGPDWFPLSEQASERRVLPGVTARLNERYDTNDADALLDVYYPSEIENTERKLPTVVWVHGGGFISGSKDQFANYLQILAAKDYVVVGVNYSLAPGKTYPTPVLQVNTALAYLSKNESRLHVDASNLFLAGDSAGAQIAAQLAAVISNSPYAKRVGVTPSIHPGRLRAVILHCGLYDLRNGGVYRRLVGWSYLGTKHFANDPRLEEFSVIPHLTADFPPMFISAGNADRLAPQSHLLADTAMKFDIPVESLFFPNDYKPPVSHGEQLCLDSIVGQLTLKRTIAFLKGRTAEFTTSSSGRRSSSQ
jgi:acetyl esterase